MRRVLALVVVAAAAVVAAPAIASGGEGVGLEVDLVSPFEPLTFSATFEEETCVEGDFEFVVLANDEEVTPISATQSDDDDDQFLFVLPPDTPPGELEIEVTCDDGDGTETGDGGIEWAALAITKVVSGPAPSTATFTVHVDCDGGRDGEDGPVDEVPVDTGEFNAAAELPASFAGDLHYTVPGGVHYVYTDHAVECTITEPVNGGATSVTITPPVVIIDDPEAFTATVTNTFAAAIQPTFTG